MQMLRAHSPKFHVWENVPDILGRSNESNLNFMIEALLDIGYVCSYALLNAKDYGFPQARVRAYGVCMHAAKARPIV